MTPSICTRKIRRPLTGFTLVEILLVVVILAILAAIVVPQFTHAASLSRENATKMDLFRIRTQIEIYREQHNGHVPSLESFLDQLTKTTNILGTNDAGDGSLRFGPYLREIPDNPATGGNVIGDGEPGSSDWYYDEDAGEFHANQSTEARLW